MGLANILLEPTDDGIILDLARKTVQAGEQRLMLAILENATEDFQNYLFTTDKKCQELFLEAEQWILATDDPSFFSFESICDHLNFDSRYMRKGLMCWKAAKLNADPKQRVNGTNPTVP